MKKYIIITSINPLSDSTKKFISYDDWEIIIVGDAKSIPIPDRERLKFISLDSQKDLDFKIANKLPLNHYSRKNIGYLHAIANKATVIYDTDDDNEPLANWNLPLFKCNQRLSAKTNFINVYKYFSRNNAWPRGFPLEYVINQASLGRKSLGTLKKIAIWQGLVNGDPDVDAVFRLIFKKSPEFAYKDPIYLNRNNFCSINSQNTFWSREAFPLLYLPSYVNFRFTDILRGYIAQKILWDHDLYIGYLPPNVFQKRNPHNVLDDFADELPTYPLIGKIVHVIENTGAKQNMLDELINVYQKLYENNYVNKDEVKLVKLWSEDIINLGLY